MKVEYITDPFPYTLIDDFYDQKELDGIWQELDFYCYPEKLSPSDKTYPAMDQFGNIMKKNHGLQLDLVYRDQRMLSNILSINRKILQSDTIKSHPNWFYQNLYIDLDFTLLSYYENGDYYKPHQDAGTLTVLTWLYKGEEKKFSGGDFHFPDYNIDVEVKNNRMIIFPSMIWHSVDKIKMDHEHVGNGLGRWCITQFLSSNLSR